MNITKPKYILTTKKLFIISFILFSLMSLFFILEFSLHVLGLYYFITDSIGFGHIAILFFFLSFGFYTVMPILRFIFNYRKIETEEEKKSVSGFYIRYFGGFLVGSLLLYFGPGGSILGGSIDKAIIVEIIGLFIFYIVSIATLYIKKLN